MHGRLGTNNERVIAFQRDCQTSPIEVIYGSSGTNTTYSIPSSSDGWILLSGDEIGSQAECVDHSNYQNGQPETEEVELPQEA